MNGLDFLRIVDGASPFLEKMGFLKDAPLISGRYYRVTFTGEGHVVLISYEPGDDALFVMVFTREGGQLSDIDNRLKTPRLTDLNSRYMHAVTNSERAACDSALKSMAVHDKAEQQLLKAVKELCLVLPKYFSRSQRRFA